MKRAASWGWKFARNAAMSCPTIAGDGSAPPRSSTADLTGPNNRVLGGNWGLDGFRAGGTVENAGEEVSHVRLTDSEGKTFEDTVDDDVVLFMSNEPVAMPMHFDLLDAGANVIATDEWGFVDE
jgi:hypothetical protein